MLQTHTTSSPRRSRGYWQEHVNAWEATGGTQSDYCRQHNLSERLFSLWKNKFIKEKTTPQTEAEFVPVLVKDKATSTGYDSNIAITLPNGIRLDVQPTISGSEIAALAKHLVALSC